jgi:hypothetical protein
MVMHPMGQHSTLMDTMVEPIYNEGVLYLTNCILRNNQAGDGGAWDYGGLVVMVEQSTTPELQP